MSVDRARAPLPGRHFLARDVAVGAVLTACAGALDALALFALGRAFAGIVTANLVTAGYGLGTANFALVRPTVVAVLGTLAGEALWAKLIHRTGRAAGDSSRHHGGPARSSTRRRKRSIPTDGDGTAGTGIVH